MSSMLAHHGPHVARTGDLRDCTSRLVAFGRYRSFSEVVRAALHLPEQVEAESILPRQADILILRASGVDEQYAG